MSSIEIEKKNSPESPPDTRDRAERLGCGTAFIKGRCEKGKDVLNCVWPKATEYGIQFCDSGTQQVVRIPSSYQCKA